LLLFFIEKNREISKEGRLNTSMPRSGRWLHHFLQALRGAFSVWCGFSALSI
jgi:hypothetical protein